MEPCGLWQSEHFTLPSRIGWCEGLSAALRTCLWQRPHVSASMGRCVVVKGATVSDFVLSWMLWQSLHATSFFECLPDSQNARCRLPAWHVRQTALFSPAEAWANLFSILFFIGSSRCLLASPWHAWHMLPLASFLAPCFVSAIDWCGPSWQAAQTGSCCADTGDTNASAIAA